MEIIFASGGTYLDDHCSGDHECIFFFIENFEFPSGVGAGVVVVPEGHSQ